MCCPWHRVKLKCSVASYEVLLSDVVLYEVFLSVVSYEVLLLVGSGLFPTSELNLPTSSACSSTILQSVSICVLVVHWFWSWLYHKIGDWSYFRIESSDIFRVFQCDCPISFYSNLSNMLVLVLAQPCNWQPALLQNWFFRDLPHVPARLSNQFFICVLVMSWFWSCLNHAIGDSSHFRIKSSNAFHTFQCDCPTSFYSNPSGTLVLVLATPCNWRLVLLQNWIFQFLPRVPVQFPNQFMLTP